MTHGNRHTGPLLSGLCHWQAALGRLWPLGLALVVPGFGAETADAVPAFRPAYYSRSWTTDDGLPHNYVTEVIQDSTGYLWLGTAGGLARFDGHRFKEFALPARYRTEGYNIRGLVEEDPQTLVLLPTSGDIVRLRDGVFTPHPASALVQGRQPRDLFVDREGALWLGMLDGTLLRWKDGTGRWFGREDGLDVRQTRFTFAVDAEGATWIACGRYLGRYHHNRLVPAAADIGETMLLAGSRNGALWIATPTRVLQFTGRQAVTVLMHPPWDGEIGWLQRLFADSEGTLWFACAGRGFFKWNGGAVEPVESAYSGITALTEDREGTLWLATNGSGLGQLHHWTYQLVSIRSALGTEVGNAVLRDATGELWLANNSSGIVRLKGGQPERVRLGLAEGPPLHLNTLAFDLAGNLWCGGREGLFRATPPFTGRVERVPELQGDVRLLQLARNGDIWFAAQPGRFGYFREGRPKFFTAADGYDGQNVRSLAESRQGTIWAGAFNGDLFRFEGGHLTRFTTAEGLNGEPINDVLIESETDALWIATARGLLLRQQDKFTLFTREQGLADDMIGQLIDDDQGYLWFSSRSGFYSVAKHELLEVARGRAAHVQSHRFGREQGLADISPRYNYHPAAEKSADGRLWFPTSKGVVAIDPGDFRRDRPPPPVLIPDVFLNDQPVDAGAEIRIPAGRHRIEFHFAALSFASPESVRLRHQLEGADPGWVETPRTRSASYSGLAPGVYRLRLTAASQPDQWNDTEAVLAVRVLPAWWQNPWILFFGILAAGSALGLAVRTWSQRQLRLRLRRLEQEHALERERSRIARDLHDELGGSLTEANFLIERLRHMPPEKLSTELGHLAGHVRHLGMDLASIVWTVSPKHNSLDQLAAFLRRYALRFFRHTPVEVTVNEPGVVPPLPLTPDVQHNLLAMAKESLTNALKHSLAQHVILELSCVDDTFELAVLDDGVGFDPEGPGSREGNGLANLRMRAAEIGAHLTITSAPGRGTQLRLRYPYFPTANLISRVLP